MNNPFAFVILSCLAVVPATPALAQKVNTDYDKTYDFEKVHTYAWKEGTPVPNPLMHQRVINAIDYHLSMKGFQKQESNPDMYVSYYASATQETQLHSWGYGPRWGYSGNIDVQKILVGTLVVDLVDARENKLFWRGVASDTVSDKPEKNEKKLNKAAEKMFDKFPPEPKE